MARASSRDNYASSATSRVSGNLRRQKLGSRLTQCLTIVINQSNTSTSMSERLIFLLTGCQIQASQMFWLTHSADLISSCVMPMQHPMKGYLLFRTTKTTQTNSMMCGVFPSPVLFSRLLFQRMVQIHSTHQPMELLFERLTCLNKTWTGASQVRMPIGCTIIRCLRLAQLTKSNTTLNHYPWRTL